MPLTLTKQKPLYFLYFNLKLNKKTKKYFKKAKQICKPNKIQ